MIPTLRLVVGIVILNEIQRICGQRVNHATSSGK